ncbi:870_t:CDS:2, partial [Gigaspora margarita]
SNNNNAKAEVDKAEAEKAKADEDEAKVDEAKANEAEADSLSAKIKLSNIILAQRTNGIITSLSKNESK